MNDIVMKFKALGDETRLKIFLLLSDRNVCVRGLSKMLSISESAVSQHINILKETGLLEGRRAGYYMHYQVRKDVVRELQGILGVIAADAGGLEKLKANLGLTVADCTRACEKAGKGCNR